MPQISRYRLDRVLEEEMFRQFWRSVSALGNSSTAASFFTDLLTATEKIMLAKRFTVAVLILRGRRPVDIKQTLHVTNSTIGTVVSWLKNVKPETKRVLQSIIQESSWQKILDRIDEIVDELPPPYRSDWSRVGKEKWKRTIDRSTRNSLR